MFTFYKMSLTLKESCSMYERHCRRTKAEPPTFEAFNAKHMTCLPRNSAVYGAFRTALLAARRSEGVPVRRKLPSLFRRFSGDEPEAEAETTTPHRAFVSHTQPSYKSGLRMNIRPEAPVSVQTATEESSAMTETETEAEDTEDSPWTLQTYKKDLAASTNPKLVEKSGMMIHFVPPTHCAPLEALACKFTKSSYEILQGKRDAALKMRDGSTWSAGANWNQDDVAATLQARKDKVSGPYFIRVSGI